jgi:hypothetical protein
VTRRLLRVAGYGFLAVAGIAFGVGVGTIGVAAGLGGSAMVAAVIAGAALAVAGGRAGRR